MKKFLKRRFLPFLAVLTVLIGTLTLPIGAEIDWLSYPTSNHFDFDGTVPAELVVTRGSGIVDYENKSIKMISTEHDTFAFITGSIQLTAGADYTISMKSTQPAQIFIYNGAGHFLAQSSVAQNPKMVFTPDITGTIMIRLDNAQDYSSCVFSEIMLSVGDGVLYPYQPYIESEIRAGYEQGFNTGLDYASRVLNPLSSASYVRFFWTDNVTSGEKSVDYTYDELLASSFYDSGTVNVSKFVKEQGKALYPIDETDISSVEGYDGDIQYPLTFSMQVRWPSSLNTNQTSFSIEGPTGGSVSAGLYQLINGALENCSFYNEPFTGDGYDFGSLRNINFKKSIYFSEFSLSVSGSGMILGSLGPNLLNDFKVNFFSGGTYSQGYAAGLRDGIAVDRQEALQQQYKDGYSAGYSTGFTDGKVDGLSIARTGDFSSLILAVVEAPVNTFQSLFNFEILGMNMQAAFGALMTMCVVLIVIKKVVL